VTADVKLCVQSRADRADCLTIRVTYTFTRSAVLNPRVLIARKEGSKPSGS